MTGAAEPLLDRAHPGPVRRLGERLQRRGVVGDVYVIGGAAMPLAYDARRATRDIDAVVLPHGIVLDEAHTLAAELGLPQWWLKEQASVYVAPGGDPGCTAQLRPPGAAGEHRMRAGVPGPGPARPGAPGPGGSLREDRADDGGSQSPLGRLLAGVTPLRHQAETFAVRAVARPRRNEPTRPPD